jgi:hypothetical protein
MPFEMFVSGEGLAAIRAKDHFEGECVGTRVARSTNSSEDSRERRIAKARETVS